MKILLDIFQGACHVYDSITDNLRGTVGTRMEEGSNKIVVIVQRFLHFFRIEKVHRAGKETWGSRARESIADTVRVSRPRYDGLQQRRDGEWLNVVFSFLFFSEA